MDHTEFETPFVFHRDIHTFADGLQNGTPIRLVGAVDRSKRLVSPGVKLDGYKKKRLLVLEKRKER